MEMRYFWLLCQEAQRALAISHHPGQEKLGDCPTKAHFGKGHQRVRSYYLHEPNSPTVLYQASMPSIRRECAEILGDRYHGKIPLAQISMDQVQDIAANMSGWRPLPQERMNLFLPRQRYIWQDSSRTQ